MADYMSAEIFIGGQVPPDLVAGLCKEITVQGVSIDWGEEYFLPESALDLLAARQEFQGVPLLHLCDVEASYGAFHELEAFLDEHGIAYQRRSDAKYEFDAELIEFRPGLDKVRYLTDKTGKPHVPLEDLAGVTAALDQAVDIATGKSAAELLGQLQTIRQLLKDCLPVVLPALAPFEIAKTRLESLFG